MKSYSTNPQAAMPPIPQGFIEETKSLGISGSQALLEALDGDPVVSVRLNSRKPASSPLWEGAEKVKWNQAGLYLPERPLFTLMPELHAGAFYVQEAASMIAGEAARRLMKSPCAVLDMCAAPGGKTTALADALPDGSVIVANEAEPQRARVLAENVMKWGCPDIAVTCARGEEFAPMRECFDLVNVDAPCSGEGMMRKEAVARSQWSQGLVRQCSQLQREILSAAVETLKPGGLLFYSTCTFNRRENEMQAEWLREEFGMIPADPGFPAEWNLPDGIDTDMRCVRFMPHITRSEGLFFCALRKPGTHIAPAFPAAAAGKQSPCSGWLTDPQRYIWTEEKETVSAVAPALQRLLQKLPRRARVLLKGLSVATVKGRDLIPTEQLALSTALNRKAFPECALTEADALRYLRRETFQLPEETPKGFILMTFNGLPLGFMKNLGNRANNLYPAEWRIRMK